jgi:hypothetical protein
MISMKVEAHTNTDMISFALTFKDDKGSNAGGPQRDTTGW